MITVLGLIMLGVFVCWVWIGDVPLNQCEEMGGEVTKVGMEYVCTVLND